MDVHATLRFLRRWLPLLLIGPLLGGIAGYVVVRQVPSTYEATVTLLVGQGGVEVSTGSDQLRSAEQLAQTYAEAVRTRPVLTEAADRVGLRLSVRELMDRVRARRVLNTQLLRISASDHDPAVAAAMANTVAQVFVAKNQEVQAARFASSRDSLRRLVTSLQTDLETKTAQLEELRAQPASPDRAPELSRVQAELSQLQAMHGDTLRSYENLRVVEARGMNTLTVIELAVSPEEPVRPNRMLVTLLAVLGGLLLATGCGAVAEYLDDLLRDRQRVSLATGLATLGLVPQGDPGTGLRDPANRRLAESYRLLRSNILASLTRGRLHSLLVASPAVGEGKSTTAANLAMVLAESGQRVILVDADMHRPTQMKLFGVPGRRGLSTLLLDPDQAPATVLRPTPFANLRVLPAGPTPADPSALLSASRVEEVLAELQSLCDVLVVDTPPLLAQPDAALLGSRVDGILLVVDATRSRGRQAARAVEVLRESGAFVLGAVLNRIPKKTMEYSAYDGYYALPPDQSSTPPDGDGPGSAEPGHTPKPKPKFAGVSAISSLD